MKFVDVKNKKVKWWNRNYFFAGTIMIIAVNILLFWLCGNHWESGVLQMDNLGHWSDPLYLNPIIRSFLNCFSHANWQHVLLNMLCFAGCGLYLERKTGSFGILGVVFVGAFLSSVATTANDLSIYWHGFSGVNYFLYACIIIDYIFSFRKEKRSKTNIILGAIVLALIYLAMCFCEGVSGFGFAPYPYDLINNMGHYTGFLMGLVVSLTFNIAEIVKKHSVDNGK